MTISRPLHSFYPAAVTKDDNQSSWILHLKPSMYVNDQITWNQFEQKFREAFGRDMTSDEHNWFYSIWAIASPESQGKAKAAAA